MKLINIVNETIREYLIEQHLNQNYFRAVTEFIGDKVIFKPMGYYEAFDDEGNPEFHTGDVFASSEIPELSASKTIGGALLGVWSMLNHHDSLNENKIYVYSINQKPDKDLSHIRADDFEYIKEVRYKNPVKGNYIGYFIFNNEFHEKAKNFYERFTRDPWEEFTEEQIKMWEDFERYISNVSEKDLK